VTIAELAPGANFTSVLTLVPKVAGIMTVGRADVDYKYRLPPEESPLSDEEGEGALAEDDLADVHTLSTQSGVVKIDILKPDVYARVSKERLVTVLAVACLAAVLVFFPFFTYTAKARANDAAPLLGSASSKKGL